MRSAIRTVAGIVVGAIVLSACGGGDKTDLEAYCELVRQGAGVGTDGATVQAAEYELLLEVAPAEIRDALQQLSNTTRSLSDISDLAQLFEAAFDPDAQAARDAFTSYAVVTCGIDEEALPAGRVASTGELIDDVRSFVDTNFAGESWIPKVRFDIERQDGALHNLSVTFVIEADDEEPIQACNALAVYLYAIRDAAGEVSVIDDGLTVARRSGPDSTCVEV